MRTIPANSDLLRLFPSFLIRLHKTGLTKAIEQLEVGEEKVDSIVIALGRGAMIRGRVVASGSGAGTFGRVYVRLETTSESDTATPSGAQVKKDSSFEFTGVSDGSYAFHAHVLEPGWFVKSAHLGNEDVLEKGLQVENRTVSGSLEVIISSGIAQLEGTVTDNEKKQPLAGQDSLARRRCASD